MFSPTVVEKRQKPHWADNTLQIAGFLAELCDGATEGSYETFVLMYDALVSDNGGYGGNARVTNELPPAEPMSDRVFAEIYIAQLHECKQSDTWELLANTLAKLVSKSKKARVQSHPCSLLIYPSTETSRFRTAKAASLRL